MALVDPTGRPLLQKRINFILSAKEFCEINCCEGFKLLQTLHQQQPQQVPPPILVLCMTCKFLKRNNDVPEMFADKTGILNIKADADDETPDQ